MLIVKVFINNTEIIRKTARRLDVPAKETNRYETDEGDIIERVFDDGAAKLAIKLLDGVKA